VLEKTLTLDVDITVETALDAEAFAAALQKAAEEDLLSDDSFLRAMAEWASEISGVAVTAVSGKWDGIDAELGVNRDIYIDEDDSMTGGEITAVVLGVLLFVGLIVGLAVSQMSGSKKAEHAGANEPIDEAMGEERV